MPHVTSADGPTPGSSADDVPEADPYDVARTICLQQLASSPKTRGQLATVLRRRGIDDETATAVLDSLALVAVVATLGPPMAYAWQLAIGSIAAIGLVEWTARRRIAPILLFLGLCVGIVALVGALVARARRRRRG